MRAPWIDASSWWTTASSSASSSRSCWPRRTGRSRWPTDGTTALEWLVERTFSLVLTDLCLPGIDGLDLIREIRQRDLPVTVIVMTGYATIESAVEAMKLGAYDLILKPIDPIRLEVVVEQALEDRRLIDEVGRPAGAGSGSSTPTTTCWGESPRMREVFDRVARVASSSCNVLVTGETGTGKELVAQAIHYSDVTRRRAAAWPSTARPCPSTLLESELFGHERGCVHRGRPPEEGAVRAGRAGARSSSTRSASMPLGMQAKLLRVLQDGHVRARRRHRVDPGRLPRHRRDQPQPGRGRRRRPVPRGPVSTGSTSSRSSCPRSASGSRTSRSWSITSSSKLAGARAARQDGLARDPVAARSATTGRATSASSSTSSSRRWSPRPAR